MTADPHELFHAVLDGEASAEEIAALDALLQADPQAHARFDELRGLHRLLARVPSIEPPSGLAESVLARIPKPHAPGRGTKTSLPRYAAAFIAGLALAVALYESGGDAEMDLGALTGTLVDRGSADIAGVRPVHIEIDAAGVLGGFGIRRSGEIVILSVEITDDGGTDLVLSLSESTRVVGFAGLDGHQPAITLTAGAFQIDQPGRHRYVVLIRDAGPGLAVEFRRQGAMVHEAILPVPGV